MVGGKGGSLTKASDELYKISLKDIKKAKNLMKVEVKFNSPHPLFGTQILMKDDKKEDIRIIEMQFKIAPPPIKALLEIKAPAGKELIQIIPIANMYNKDVEVTATYTKKGPLWWTFPPRLRLNANEKSGDYKVYFFPKHEGVSKASLELQIVSNNSSQIL